MHPSIAVLLKVQGVDNEIRFVKEAIATRPRELESDRQKLARSRDAIQTLTEESRRIRMQVSKSELEIKRCDGDIEKATAALNAAKTNAEYAVLKAQIEKVKEERSGLEERALLELSQIDDLAARKKNLEAAFAAEEKDFARKEAEVREIVAGLESRLAKLNEDRAKAISGIDKDHLALYDRVLQRHGSMAIVGVRDSICQGCFMSVTTQEINLLLIGQELVRCRSCSRLLYVE